MADTKQEFPLATIAEHVGETVKDQIDARFKKQQKAQIKAEYSEIRAKADETTGALLDLARDSGASRKVAKELAKRLGVGTSAAVAAPPKPANTVAAGSQSAPPATEAPTKSKFETYLDMSKTNRSLAAAMYTSPEQLSRDYAEYLRNKGE